MTADDTAIRPRPVGIWSEVPVGAGPTYRRGSVPLPIVVAVAALGPCVRAGALLGGSDAAIVLLGAVLGVGIVRGGSVHRLPSWRRLLGPAVAAAVTVPFVGALIGGWLTAGVVTAVWALTGTAPLASLPDSDDGARVTAVAAAVVTTVLGRTGSPRLVITLTVGALLVVAWNALRPGRLRLLVGRVERWVGTALTRGGFALVGIPLVVVPYLADRLLVTDPLERRHQRPSNWRRVPTGDRVADEPWRRETRSATSGRQRTRRRVSTALATLALAGLVAGAVVLADDARKLGTNDTSPGNADAHRNTDPDTVPAALADAPWYPEYLQDISWLWSTAISWDPLAPVRLRDVTTRHINIVDGARRSWRAPDCDCRRIDVWIYGGSTAFGLGQRDEHTFASELARDAWKDGIALDVSNRGVVGDTHWEEAQRFAWDVATLDPPDLVVFFDGINDRQALDRMTTDTRQPVGLVKEDFWTNYLATMSSSSMDGRWAPAGDAGAPGPPGASVPVTEPLRLDTAKARGAMVAKRYEQSRSLSRDTAATHHIPVVWMWQPSIDHRPRIDGEPEPAGREFAREIDDAAVADMGSDVVSLVDAFDGERRPLFWDQYHTNELGAALTAEEAYPSIGPLARRILREADDR